MKVHITADMEGIASLTHDEQTGPQGIDYPRMRKIMTGEVLAAIDGAIDAGAERIVVCDAHDKGRNLLVEEFPEEVEVVQGSPYKHGMMAGISADFDASFQIGYHSMRHTHAGTIGHTYSFSITELRFNGIVIGESGLSAAIAGHFGVPVVLVSGDMHAVREAQKLIKGVIGVSTKEGVGLYAAHSLSPAKARKMIRDGAKKALERRHCIKPVSFNKPVNMRVSFERPLMAEYASNIPLVRREDILSVSYKAKDVLDAFKVFEVMMTISNSAKSEGPI